MAAMIDLSVGGDSKLFGSNDKWLDLETELRIGEWQCLVMRIND